MNLLQITFDKSFYPYLFWVFILSYTLAFMFLYRLIKERLSQVQPVQLTYAFSLIFTIATIVLSVLFRKEGLAILTFAITGATYWIVYFGWTPRWSSRFVITFLFALIPTFIGNYLLFHYLQDAVYLDSIDLKLSNISIFSIPLELFYAEFFLGYISVWMMEGLAKRK